MDIGESFDKTLQRYGITGTWLSRESGVNAQMISRFRNGKEVYTDTLGKLLDALPSDAQVYFCSLILRSNYRPNLEILVEDLTSDDLHDLFDLIAARIVKRSKAKAEDKDKVKVA